MILIDRPGHGWSTRARLEDSTPEIQGRMIEEALEKLGVDRAVFVVHSWAARWARGWRWIIRNRVAGLVMLAPVAYPVAGRRRMIQQDRRHAGDRPAAGLHDHAAAWLAAGRARRPRRLPAAVDAAGFVRTPRRRCCCGRASFSPMRATW